MLEQGAHSLTGGCTVLALRKFLDILISFYLYCYWLEENYRLLQKIFNTWKHKSENEINLLKIGNTICCSDCPMASLLNLHQERGSVWGVSREWPSQWGDASFEIELFLSVLISYFCASFLLTTFFFFLITGGVERACSLSREEWIYIFLTHFLDVLHISNVGKRG